MNNFIGIGNLVRDPELKHAQNGTAICKFTIAINRMKKEEVDFINVVTFNKVAENVANYLAKGSKVAVQGRVQTGSYENKEGAKVYTTDIIASNVQFLSKPGQKEEVAEGFKETDHMGDIPF